MFLSHLRYQMYWLSIKYYSRANFNKNCIYRPNMALTLFVLSGSARCEEGWESFGAACYFISGMPENWYDANVSTTGGGLIISIFLLLF